ncbi:MAG TPA: HD domain-containing protein [Candidatus Mcinerneyibacteriales bacterium]|nr:HD domain-containing protein [Candidatus Mcinerneyibacteriales bacterium]HPE21090.1 HD domain-containing protein [Candidatus Mcinerneyibacteriales bacterium]HPJ69794.1 HD domain-containing protein [Candidatus Mcinerneyibacteriales bacterium]HPQ88516.1 HD domain-containing protein [Candidatus Mcinerneyibacteriales bacterium]
MHLFDTLGALASALDLVENELYDHHHRVAYISYRLGREAGLDHEMLSRLVYAALIHDIGVITKKEKEELLEFNFNGAQQHAARGASLLSFVPRLASLAPIVHDHHRYWNTLSRDSSGGKSFELSDILHLADRIEVVIDWQKDLFEQIPMNRELIERQRGIMFAPELVDLFTGLSEDMGFWQALKSANIMEWLSRVFRKENEYLGPESVINVARFAAYAVDFRSQYTFAHSSGVSSLAEYTGRQLGWDEKTLFKIKIAGLLHDVGKLVLPREVIEKNGPLNARELSLVHTHPFYTGVLVKQMGDMEEVHEYASYHHERLDGSGYPFHLEGAKFTSEAQMVALADIVCALLEDRAYRPRKGRNYVAGILEEYRRGRIFSADLADYALSSLDALMEIHQQVEQDALKDYMAWNKSFR